MSTFCGSSLRNRKLIARMSLLNRRFRIRQIVSRALQTVYQSFNVSGRTFWTRYFWKKQHAAKKWTQNCLPCKEQIPENHMDHRCEKTCLQRIVNNKGADQPAHPRRLISAFVIHFLKSTISRLATSKISNFLASLCS